jgi:hypothetical protein
LVNVLKLILDLHLKTWFYGLLQDVLQHFNGDYSLAAYFEFLTVEIHWCTVSLSNGPHLEVQSPPRRMSYYQVSTIAQYMYDSSIQHWFNNFTSVKTNYISRDACWRVKDGVPLCSGKRQDSSCLVISILVILILEAPEDSDTNAPSKLKNLPPWDFPTTLTPSTITKSKVKQKGITYDLMGLKFFSKAVAHFIAWYADKESSQIYTYDSMKNKGNTMAELSNLPDVTCCGQECPIALDPGPHQKQKELKEYVSKKKSGSKPKLPTDDDSLSPIVQDGPESEEEMILHHPHGKPALQINTTLPTVPAAPDSPPDSPFNIQCRCGLKGNGNTYYDLQVRAIVLRGMSESLLNLWIWIQARVFDVERQDS